MAGDAPCHRLTLRNGCKAGPVTPVGIEMDQGDEPECLLRVLAVLWLKWQCTTGPERRIARWEHEHLLDAVQQRLDANPQAMRQRRETVEHPFVTMKARMGATHFLTKTLPKVAAVILACTGVLAQSPSQEDY